MPYAPGDILLDKYRIEKTLGQGAFGEVYLVTHMVLGVPRAVKVLKRDAPGLGSSDYSEAQARFQLEAQLGAQIHPHLLLVHDCILSEKISLLEMEYAAGGSLTARLQQVRAGGQPFAIEQALRIATEIAEGLAVLHAKDIVHRDLKPSNILFDEHGQALVADLGLAQVPHGPSNRSQKSEALLPMHPGTDGYMSPEQENSGKLLKPPSDVYALGLVLFEMLTGRNYNLLKPGTRASSLRSDLPAQVDDLLTRMLSKDPEERPWDGQEAAGLLSQARDNLSLEKGQLAAEQAKKQAEVLEQAETLKREAAAREEALAKARRDAEQAQKQAELLEQQRVKDESARQEAAARQEALARTRREAQQALQTARDEAATQARQQAEQARLARSAEKPFIARFWPGLVVAGLLLFFGIGSVLNQRGTPATPAPIIFATLTSAADTAIPATYAPAATTAPAAPAGAGQLVGISMPTKTSTRWISDGNSMVKAFEALGYKTNLQFADNDSNNQIAQIQSMVTQGARVLIIAAIDGSILSDVLQRAKDSGTLVISYDRLITSTPNVDYYVTFDNFGVGVIQGTQIIDGLGLMNSKGPFNIELFGGSPDDTNAGYFYNGAMSILQPYIDSKKLVVVSGQVGMDKVGTLRWLAATAQARMDNLLSAYYTRKRVDAVLSPYDGLSIGILASLKGVGYCTAAQPCPVVTGQDCEVASIKSIIAKEQRYSIFKDTRLLAAQTAKMVDQALKGQIVDINNTTTYNNGVKVVPAYLLTPFSVDINNYKQVLVNSGYYLADQLK